MNGRDVVVGTIVVALGRRDRHTLAVVADVDGHHLFASDDPSPTLFYLPCQGIG